MQIKNKIKIAMATISSFAVLAYAKMALAAVSVPVPTGDGTIMDTADPNIVFNKIINTVMILLGGVAVIMILWGGFLILMSGDAKSSEKGRNVITYTVIGILVMGIAAVIVKFALGVIGK